MLDQKIWLKKEQLNWPENYYRETDARKRKELLERQMKEDDSKKNHLRLCLWEKRYLDEKGTWTEIDYYLKIWNELNFIADRKKSFLGKKIFKKSINQMKRVYGFDVLCDNSDYKKIWYDEYVNFCCFYIQISMTDKNYTNVLFNIGKISEENLIVKLAEDLCRHTVEMPRLLGMEEEFKLLEKAAEDSFGYFYPKDQRIYKQIKEKYMNAKEK